MSHGWECPKCGQVYAPFVQKCWTCMPQAVSAAGTMINGEALYPCGAPASQCRRDRTGCPPLVSSYPSQAWMP